MKIDIPGQYRMIAYTITEAGPGKWKWTLIPSEKPDAMTPLVHGVIKGARADAEKAAHAAIDKDLGGTT